VVTQVNPECCTTFIYTLRYVNMNEVEVCHLPPTQKAETNVIARPVFVEVLFMGKKTGYL
jgi:hypothetical protein